MRSTSGCVGPRCCRRSAESWATSWPVAPPACHGEQTQRWLDRQRARLLPCAYSLLTFTLPSDLRALARAHQKIVYGVRMRAAAAALLTLTADLRYLGARPGVLTVLHTWTRAPHVHMLVAAGGLRGVDQTWVTPRHVAFLVPGRALSRLFRGKVRAGLRKAGLLEQVPPAFWRQEWVVHVQQAGTGENDWAFSPVVRRSSLGIAAAERPRPAPRASNASRGPLKREVRRQVAFNVGAQAYPPRHAIDMTAAERPWCASLRPNVACD